MCTFCGWRVGAGAKSWSGSASERVKVLRLGGWLSVAGAHQSADAALFLYEPAGRGNLAVRAGRLRASLVHPVCDGPFFTLRVEQPSPLPRRLWHRGESVLRVKFLLVHNRHFLAPGVRTQSQGARFLISVYICVAWESLARLKWGIFFAWHTL